MAIPPSIGTLVRMAQSVRGCAVICSLTAAASLRLGDDPASRRHALHHRRGGPAGWREMVCDIYRGDIVDFRAAQPHGKHPQMIVLPASPNLLVNGTRRHRRRHGQLTSRRTTCARWWTASTIGRSTHPGRQQPRENCWKSGHHHGTGLHRRATHPAIAGITGSLNCRVDHHAAVGANTRGRDHRRM